jgi:hypothetical protein
VREGADTSDDVIEAHDQAITHDDGRIGVRVMDQRDPCPARGLLGDRAALVSQKLPIGQGSRAIPVTFATVFLVLLSSNCRRLRPNSREPMVIRLRPNPVWTKPSAKRSAEGLDPDDPAVVTAMDFVRWELSMLGRCGHDCHGNLWDRFM